MRIWIVAPVAVSLALLTAACGDSKVKRATTGAAGGALLGSMLGGPIGALVGAGLGGAGGVLTAEEVPEIEYARVDAPLEPVRQARVVPPRETGALTNQHVREAQIALTKLGIFNDRIDGLYGRRTIRAVKEFQAQTDELRYTGALDAGTRRQIRLAATEHQEKRFAENPRRAMDKRQPAATRASAPDAAGRAIPISSDSP